MGVAGGRGDLSGGIKDKRASRVFSLSPNASMVFDPLLLSHLKASLA